MATKYHKPEIITALAEETGLTKQDAALFLNALPKVIHEMLQEVGDTVSIRGFIGFERKLQAARTQHNPHTQELMEVPEKEVNRVKIASGFK